MRIILLFLILCSKVYAQGITVEYAIEKLPSKRSQSKKYSLLSEQIAEKMKSQKAVLHIKDSRAKYFIKESLFQGDSRLLEISIKMILDAEEAYWTDLKTNTLVIENEVIKERTAVSFKPIYHWTLTDEQKMINNLECFKATVSYLDFTNRERAATAWYAPKLPYHFGPKGLFGLPGLIVQLDLHATRYTIDSIIEDNVGDLSFKDSKVMEAKIFQQRFKEAEIQAKRAVEFKN